MKIQDRELIERRRAAHWKALEALAGQVGCKARGITLWRALNRLEHKVARACEAYSSDSAYGLEQWENDKINARIELARIFGGKIPNGIFINGDPRGHMLKLDTDTVKLPEGMQHDWGNYGILAAEIDSV